MERPDKRDSKLSIEQMFYTCQEAKCNYFKVFVMLAGNLNARSTFHFFIGLAISSFTA